MFENAGVQFEEPQLDQLAASHVKTTSSGILVETKDPKNALHVVATKAGGGFDYYRREQASAAWSGPFASMGSPGNVHAPVVLGGLDSCLDAIVREVKENREIKSSKDQPGRLVQTYASYKTPPEYPWKNVCTELPKAKDVIGTPGVCRWNTWDRGLDVIAPVASGGLRHWYRNEHGSWYTTKDIETATKFNGCAIIMGPGKRLEVVAVDAAGNLWHIQRDAKDQWKLGIKIGQGFAGAPALVESARTNAACDLVVPLSKGQIAHYTVSSSFQLSQAASFGEAAIYGEIGLVYNHAGQLEVVARRASGTLEHYVNRLDGKGWVHGTSFPALANPSQQGSWKVEFDTKVIGVHASVLHTGQVLLFGVDDETAAKARGAFLDLKTGLVKLLPDGMPHVFCSGHALLGNGDLLVAGGHDHHEHMLHVFARNQSGSWAWSKRPDLRHGRWYPTCTTLHDGKVLILSGSYKAGGKAINNSYEIYDPTKPQDPRKRVDLGDEIKEKFCDDFHTIDMYPFVYILPNRRVFVHSRYTTRFFDYPKAGQGSWSCRILANYKSSRTYGYQGTSVLLPLKPGDKEDYAGACVAIFGGAGQNATIDTPATATTELLVTDTDKPAWVYGPNLLQGRVMPDAVLLPDGKVLITSGSRTGKGDACNAKQPELTAEMFDPETKTITRMARMSTPRLYHASAVLLPDARVLVAGKCKVFNAAPYDYPEHRGEVFTPPYLLTGKPRPRILAATDTVASAGATIDIKVDDVPAIEIKSVILIRPSTVTHSLNMDQRAVFLPFAVKENAIEARAPKSNWVVPPGYYMLFVVSKDGVPSEASFVRVDVYKA